MYWTKTVQKLVPIIGRELYTIARESGEVEPVTIDGRNNCFVLAEFPGTGLDKKKIMVKLYVDGTTVMYRGETCSYTYGSLKELVSVMDACGLYSAAADALRLYARAYEEMTYVVSMEEARNKRKGANT